MTPLEFGWFLPSNGDTTSFAQPVAVPPSIELFDRVTRAAEDAGFEYMLVPVTQVCWEAWIASAMMVARSRSIKMLIASRPGYINPALMAKMIATYDQLSGGRIAINLIAGGSDEDTAADGVTLPKEQRYEAMDEEVRIMKALWASPNGADFDGKYYTLKNAVITPSILQRPHPKFYLGGGSRQAWEVSARHADVHLFWGDTPERIAGQIAEIRKLAVPWGREHRIGFGMRLQMICRETEDEAWAAAHSLIAGASEAHKEIIRNTFTGSVANQRMQELARAENDRLGPNLWTGITKVRPGAGVAVVGNPRQCAATLQQFIDVGCHSFCLSGYLHDEEATRFGQLVRPLLPH